MHARLVTLALVSTLGASCTSPSVSCDGAAMRDRIEALSAGETLALDASCVIEGGLTIPAGATVRGGDFVLGADDAIVLTPAPEVGSATTLAGAHVEGGSATASLRVRGPGFARIASTVFALERGVAIGVAEASVAIVDVTVSGNVDPAHVLDVPVPPPADAFATYGLAAIEGAHVEITGSRLERFASAAIVCTDAELSIADVTLDENRGFGVESFACSIEATDLEVMHTRGAPTLLGMGIALADGSELESTSGLRLHDTAGFGLFVTASRANVSGAIVERVETAGVWVEHGGELSVEDATFTENRGTAIAAVGADTLEIAGTTITGTGTAIIPSASALAGERVADAIHVVQTNEATTVSIADTMLAGNERVGLVLDGHGEALALSITSTRVESSGDALGVVAQNVADLPATWDSGVTRVGSALTLDASAGPLVVTDGSGAVGVLMPPTISF